MQAHMSGQVTGQVTNQADFARQNGNALPLQQPPNGIRSWHMEGDHTALRTCINKEIHNFLSGRLKEQHPDWQMRLPEMARRSEGLLFREASIKEEYMNVANLEQCLQSMVKRLQNRSNSLSQQSAPVGTMIPTLGLQQCGSVSTMIPTPGTDTSMVSGPGPSNMIHSAIVMENISMCNTEDPMTQQNGNALPVQQPANGIQSWHMEGDHIALRTCINKEIHIFLSGRLKEQHPDWQMRLLEMAKRVEGLLFREASTKEEYMNVANLEQRLQSMITRLQNRNNPLSQQSAPARTMIPTLGLQ